MNFAGKMHATRNQDGKRNESELERQIPHFVLCVDLKLNVCVCAHAPLGTCMHVSVFLHICISCETTKRTICMEEEILMDMLGVG